jgi:hypothetical protein
MQPKEGRAMPLSPRLDALGSRVHPPDPPPGPRCA